MLLHTIPERKHYIMNKELKLTTLIKLTILALCLFYINDNPMKAILIQFAIMIVASATVLDGLEMVGESLYIIIESLVDITVATIVVTTLCLTNTSALDLLFAILLLTTLKVIAHWFELTPISLVRRQKA